MSESEVNIEEHRSTTGVESKYADIASDDHALKDRFGSDEQAKKIEFEAEVIGERVAQWYDDPAAAIREYLSNAETACVRRAKQELIEGGYEVPDGVTEMLAAAQEKCDYQPTIEVTYNRNPEETRFIIEDNGIGISTDEYLVLKKIGYSTSHMDGERLGQFGMGYMSGFQLSGTEGVFNMRTRSFLTEETYSTANYITNFEYLDGLREEYGTRFEFPAFCEKAERIDVRHKVEEFAEGMRVTVLYRESDSSGQEIFNEDYTPSKLAENYSDDALVIQFENEFFEAVMSPKSPESRGYKTYNISMPIRRNTEKYGTEPTFRAPWTWDFRGKEENGPIVKSDDDSIIGLAPVSDSKYESLPEERKDSFIRRSEVPDDAIVMPTPASSRDSYESGHDEFWYYVSEKLRDAWQQEVADRLSSLSNFDDFKDASSREKAIIIRGYKKFGPGYGKNDPDNVVEHFEDEMGITLDKDVAAKLDRLTESHRVVNRDSDTPHQKSSTTGNETWKIIDEVSNGGTVYMGKTISAKKADIAWELHDNNVVVRLDGQDYDELEQLWGWEKLKDIPTRNLKEKLPNLPDDVAEKYENKSDDDYKQNSSSKRTSRNPKTKRLKVYGRRRGHHRRGFNNWKAESVYDKMDNGETLSAGYMDAEKVIIFDQNQTSVGSAKRSIKRDANIAVLTCPKYVYKYLKDADNIYEDVSTLKEEEKQDATVTLSGDREVPVYDLPDDELILLSAQSLEKRFDDDRDTLREWVEEQTGQTYKNLSFVDKADFDQYHFVNPNGGTIFRFSGHRGYGERFRIDGAKASENHIINEILTPDNIDWDHDFMQAINQRRTIEGDADLTMDVVQYLREHDALPTTDDE